MKKFDDFRALMGMQSGKIHDEIQSEVLKASASRNHPSKEAEHEFYRTAWVEIGTMKLLEKYHQWLNS